MVSRLTSMWPPAESMPLAMKTMVRELASDQTNQATSHQT